MRPLYPFQQKALDDLKTSLRSGRRRPIIQMPTGGGKTVLASHIVHGALNKSNTLAFCVPLLTLIDQTIERFIENGIAVNDIGVIQGNHAMRRPQAPIQIASTQTLARRDLPKSDIVVIDEVHVRYKVIEDWIKADEKKIFIGLSATPWSRGLADFWDDLIIPTSVQELIDQGWLSPFKAFAPSHPDLTGIKIVAGDYHEGQLSERMSKAAIVGDVVHTWLEKAERRPTLVFAVDRAHANVLHEGFEKAGVASAYVDANTPREERGDIGRRLNGGALEVICSVGTMTTGVDLDVRCIVFARPTRSEILLVQAIGRGLRPKPDKVCLILDHSDSLLRLGLPTDIHHAELIGGENKRVSPIERKPPLPKECPACAFLVPAGIFECPNCGHKPKRASVRQAEGELVDISVARKAAKRENREMTWSEKAKFFGELRGYAQERGYKEGWAANKYRERLGVWPNDPSIRYSPVRPCSPATASWIKSQQIRWAKGRAKRDTDEIIRDSLAEIGG